MTVIFLDRDGVINRNKATYVRNEDELEFIPGAFEGLAALRDAGFTVVVVSNQAGVGRGLIGLQELERIDSKLVQEVKRHGGYIAASYYCTHRKDEGCLCRKPLPGLFRKACREMGIDLSSSYYIGDAATDVEAGHRAGLRTVLVLTGLSSPEEAANWNLQPHHTASDLPSAVHWILDREHKSL